MKPFVFFFYCVLLFSSAFPQSKCECSIAVLKYGGGGDWYVNPSSLPNLIDAVKTRTSVPICDTVATVEIMNENLFRYPFIYMTGHGNIHFTEQEKIRLRAFLIAGGFLWADDCYGMDQSFRREIASVFPQNPLVVVPPAHPIYKSKYNLPGLPKIHEHNGDPATGYGVFFNNRLLVYYSYSSDIGDGMEDIPIHNDGPKLHEIALQMGINIVVWFFSP
jgi:hypothetical protein